MENVPAEVIKGFFEELDENRLIAFDEFDGQYFHLGVIDINNLEKLYRYSNVGRLFPDTSPAQVAYWPNSGICHFNGFKTRLKGRNKRIFTYLFNNPNKEIDKNILWRISGKRGKIRDANDIILFNSYITNLRRALGGAKPSHLRLRKTVMLYSHSYLTDGSDLNLDNLNI